MEVAKQMRYDYEREKAKEAEAKAKESKERYETASKVYLESRKQAQSQNEICFDVHIPQEEHRWQRWETSVFLREIAAKEGMDFIGGSMYGHTFRAGGPVKNT